MLTRAWELGVLYCAYCSYGDMAIAVTDNGQVMAALSWPLHVYVYSFIHNIDIDRHDRFRCSSGTKFSKHIKLGTIS